MSQMIQVHVPNFFFGAEIQKMTEIDPKNPLFWPKIAVNQFFLKNLQVNPTWKFPNFSQYFSWTFLEFFLFQKFHLEPLFNPFLKKCPKSHLPGNSSYTKTLLTKNVPNDTSPCSNFFFPGRNPKNDRDRAKKPSFSTKNCGLSVFS